jgi:hypothetical protein
MASSAHRNSGLLLFIGGTSSLPQHLSHEPNTVSKTLGSINTIVVSVEKKRKLNEIKFSVCTGKIEINFND